MRAIRVLLVDNHEAALSTLRDMLEVESDLVVVGEACHGQEAMARLEAVPADVTVVIDITPGDRGLGTLRMLRAHGWSGPALFLTMYDNLRQQAMEAGATEFVSADARRAGVVEAIRRIHCDKAVAGRQTWQPTPFRETVATDQGPEHLIPLGWRALWSDGAALTPEERGIGTVGQAQALAKHP